MLKYGTVISTAANSNSGFNSSVILEALPAIDYDLMKKIRIQERQAEIIRRDISCGVHTVGTEDFDERDDKCTITVKDFVISPAHPDIAKFHSFSLSDPWLKDAHVSEGSVNWKNKCESTFTCLNDNIETTCTVLGKNFDVRRNGEANIWFFGRESVLEGQIYFSSEDEKMLYRVSVPEINHDELRVGHPYFRLLKISTPLKLKPYQWKSKISFVFLTLTDIYGNKGDIMATWDEGTHYDKPNISSIIY